MSMPATPTSLVYLRGATSEVEELRPLSDLAEIVSYTPLVATAAGSAASPELAVSSMPVASDDNECLTRSAYVPGNVVIIGSQDTQSPEQ